MAGGDRRSFLKRLGALTWLGALGTVAGGSPARAFQVTDNDRGRQGDPPGQGRRRYDQSGVTDTDSGTHADMAGRGRGELGEYSGVTDSDSGAMMDRPGHGRGPDNHTGITDSDSGRCADPAGRGRGGRRDDCPGER